MGIIRLLLAISIVLLHSGIRAQDNIVNANIAVLSFFIISGFYMALILDKKYKNKFIFWGNRFLRIFPIYWTVLLLTLGFVLLKFFFHFGNEDNALIHYLNYSPNPLSTEFYINLANFIVRNITLIFSLDYFRVNNSQPGYLLIPQAWTLQFELLFYLLAPIFMKMSKKIFLGSFLIYLIGFFGWIVPNHLMPPNLTFNFLSNLQFFLYGMLSYRFLFNLFDGKKVKPLVLKIIFFSFLLYLLLYNLIPIRIPILALNIENLPYFLLLIFALPSIFIQSRANVIDNFIGKLSYPVYILHLFVIKLLSNLDFDSSSIMGVFVILFITLYVSYLAVKFIDKPIDSYRQSRIASEHV